MADTQVDTTMVRAIDRVYARALLELAEEKGVLEDVAGEMADIAQMTEANPDFGQLLRSPTMEESAKLSMLEIAFKDRVHELIYQFLLVLRRKGRLQNFANIVVAFRQLYNEKHGVLEVQAEVAQPLDDATREQVGQWISGIINRKVTVREEINTELIGGVKVRAGDRLFDASVATQLRQLRRKLAATGESVGRGLMDRIVME